MVFRARWFVCGVGASWSKAVWDRNLQTYPAGAASAPFSHLSCLVGAASRSQRWFVWTPSPPHSGNKPSWSLKSSPHERGGRKPVWGEVSGLHLTQSTRLKKKKRKKKKASCVHNSPIPTGYIQTLIMELDSLVAWCRLWPPLLMAKLLSSVKYLTA